MPRCRPSSGFFPVFSSAWLKVESKSLPSLACQGSATIATSTRVIHFFVTAMSGGGWTWSVTLACACVKFLQAIQIRFGPVYAPFVADALGVDVGAFLDAIGTASLLTLFSIFLSPLQDVVGSHRMFLLGESLALLGLVCALSKHSLVIVACGWTLFLAGGSLNNGAFQSMASRCNDAASLSRVTSMLEAGWAMASLIGLPLVGVLLRRTSWSILFACLIALHVLPAIYVARKFFELVAGNGATASSEATTTRITTSVPARDESNSVREDAAPSPLIAIRSTFAHFRQTLSDVNCCLALLFGMCVTANSTLNGGALGQWLKYTYDLDSESVGLLSLSLGMGELTGAILFSRLAPIYSVTRVLWAGATALVGAQCLLAALNGIGMWAGICAFYVCAACSEFTLIASITFVSSGIVTAHSIGTLVGLYFSTFNIGATCGALFVTPLFDKGGLAAVSFTGACMVLLSACVFWYKLSWAAVVGDARAPSTIDAHTATGDGDASYAGALCVPAATGTPCASVPEASLPPLSRCQVLDQATVLSVSSPAPAPLFAATAPPPPLSRFHALDECAASAQLCLVMNATGAVHLVVHTGDPHLALHSP